MTYKLPLLEYKNLISLPDGSYKGIHESSEGFVVQDLHKGTNFGVYGSLDKALIMASAYGLNLLQPVPESTPTRPLMPAPIKAGIPLVSPHPTTPPTTAQGDQHRSPTGAGLGRDLEMSFEAYCALFANPKNKSGYKFIVDKSGSLGWVILQEGTSEYGRYASVQEALEEAYQHNLNL